MDQAEILSFFVNGFFIVFLMGGSIMILVRNPKARLNRSFFLFYLFLSIGFLTNIIYRLQNNILWKAYLTRVTIFWITFAIIFLLNFNLILAYEEKFTRKDSWVFAIAWLLFCSLYLVIDFQNGVSWVITPEAPSGVPYWSTYFTIFTLILTQSMYLTVFITATVTKIKFSKEQSKSKHFNKNIALFFLDWFLIGNILNNWCVIRENASWFSAFLYYSSFLALPGMILFWLSMLRAKKEPNFE